MERKILVDTDHGMIEAALHTGPAEGAARDDRAIRRALRSLDDPS